MSQYPAATMIASLMGRNHARCARVAVFAAALVPLGVLTIACRDTEPPPVFYMDLGDAETPLPPPATSIRMDPALKDGRAEWRDFREPQLARMTGEPGAAPGAADTARPGAPPSPDDAQIRRIRATLDEYNALVAEGKSDELIDYHVEAQIEKIESLFQRQAELMQKMGDLRRAFEAKLPDQADRIAKVFDTYDELGRAPLIVVEITMEGADRASGIIQEIPGGLRVHFELEEDVWYIKFPDMLLDQSLAMIEGVLPMFDQLKGTIESGDVPPEQMLAALEQSAQMMMNAMGGDAPREGG